MSSEVDSPIGSAWESCMILVSPDVVFVVTVLYCTNEYV